MLLNFRDAHLIESSTLNVVMLIHYVYMTVTDSDRDERHQWAASCMQCVVAAGVGSLTFPCRLHLRFRQHISRGPSILPSCFFQSYTIGMSLIWWIGIMFNDYI